MWWGLPVATPIYSLVYNSDDELFINYYKISPSSQIKYYFLPLNVHCMIYSVYYTPNTLNSHNPTPHSHTINHSHNIPYTNNKPYKPGQY